MPGKPLSGFTYDAFLTSLVMGLWNEDNAFGHLAVPTILHDDESGSYPIISLSDMLRLSARERPKGTPAHQSGYGMESGSFDTVAYAIKQPVDVDDARKAKNPVDLDIQAAVYVAQQMKLLNESKFHTAAFTTSTWGLTDQSGKAAAPAANQFIVWSASTSTPGKDVAALQYTMRAACGKKGNTLFVTEDTDAQLRFNPDVVDRVKYVNPNAVNQNQVVNASALAQYFGVKNYIVCGATQNSGKEEGTVSMAMLSTNKALLCYLDDGLASLEGARFRPSALVAIRYDLPGGQQGRRVRAYMAEDIKSNVIEADESFLYHRPTIESTNNSGKNPMGVLFNGTVTAV